MIFFQARLKKTTDVSLFPGNFLVCRMPKKKMPARLPAPTTRRPNSTQPQLI
jgi:hypothetical protein